MPCNGFGCTATATPAIFCGRRWTSPASAQPGPHFVDLDDARMGPAVQDLWMLLSGDRQQRTRQLGCLMDGYEQFRAL